MKRDIIGPILICCLFVSTTGAAVMGYLTLKGTRLNRFLQQQTVRVNQSRAMMQAMAIDLNEYSRREQSIIPMLDRLSIRMRQNTNATPAQP